MKYEENGIEVPIYDRYLIYFLLNDQDEVVYVGQTTVGLTRPYSHNDKVFSRIFITSVDKKELTAYENYYIDKYKPFYNNTIDSCYNYKIMRVRELVRSVTENKSFDIPSLRKVCSRLSITIYKSNKQEYIHIADVIKILKHLKGIKYEQ